MTITSYGYIGSGLIGLGIALGIASVLLFVNAGSGISITTPGGLDSEGTLHFPTTDLILFSLGDRLALLLPLIAAMILIGCGLSIRWKIPQIAEVLTKIEEAESGPGE